MLSTFLRQHLGDCKGCDENQSACEKIDVLDRVRSQFDSVYQFGIQNMFDKATERLVG